MSFSPRLKPFTRWSIASIFLAGFMMASLQWWDAWAASNVDLDKLPGDLKKAVQLSEAFAHGSGVFAILATLYWIDIPRRKSLNICILLTAMSGLIANGLKSAFTRVRPYADTNAIVSDNWLPFFHGSFWDATQRSFPSGHAATAVALAIGLTFVYPRGAFLFGIFAFLACLQRIVSRAHFPSDVFAGAAIACLCASIVMLCVKRTTQHEPQ